MASDFSKVEMDGDFEKSNFGEVVGIKTLINVGFIENRSI